MNETTLIFSIVQTVAIVLSLGGLFWQLKLSKDALKDSSETIKLSSKALEQSNITIQQTNEIVELSRRALQDNVDFKSLEYYVKLNDIMLNNKKVKNALFPGYQQNELHLFLGLAMSFFEDLFLRKLDKKVWEPWAKWMDEEFLHNGAFRVFWGNNSEYYTEEFQDEIDKRLKTIK